MEGSGRLGSAFSSMPHLVGPSGGPKPAPPSTPAIDDIGGDEIRAQAEGLVSRVDTARRAVGAEPRNTGRRVLITLAAGDRCWYATRVPRRAPLRDGNDLRLVSHLGPAVGGTLRTVPREGAAEIELWIDDSMYGAKPASSRQFSDPPFWGGASIQTQACSDGTGLSTTRVRVSIGAMSPSFVSTPRRPRRQSSFVAE